MYRIIGADQKEYGPVSADQLRQWLAQGRASGASLVRPEETTEWQPLSAFPEFAEALAAKFPLGATLEAHGPQSGISFEVLSRDYDLDIGQCVSNAWNLLKNNFGLIFGGTAIYFLVQGAISLLARIPILGILLWLVSLVVTGPLTGGLYLFVLKNFRRQPSDIGDIFSGFKLSFCQLVLGYLITNLFAALAALPGAVLMAYPIYLMTLHHSLMPLLLVWASTGFVCFIVPLIYFSVSWIFTLALIIDRQMDFWPAMGVSRQMVGKHWWTVFALLAVCGIINVAGVIVCCIGLFISLPISFGALMYAYERIFSAPVAPTA